MVGVGGVLGGGWLFVVERGEGGRWVIEVKRGWLGGGRVGGWISGWG